MFRIYREKNLKECALRRRAAAAFAHPAYTAVILLCLNANRRRRPTALFPAVPLFRRRDTKGNDGRVDDHNGSVRASKYARHIYIYIYPPL